jgi:hypothetical protein
MLPLKALVLALRCALCLLLLHVSLLAAPDGSYPAALGKAEALVEKVDDPDFRSRLLLEMVEHTLAGGWIDESLRLARSIPDYRRGIALGKVAAALARAGLKERVGPVVDEALAQSGFPHAWHAQAIRAEAAIAWTAAGESGRAEAIVAELTDDGARYRAVGGCAVERVRRGEIYDATVLDPPTDVKKLTPELLQLARAALEIAEMRLAAPTPDKEAAAALCRQSEAIVRACKATAGEELLDTGLLWRRLGDAKKSSEVLGVALHHLPPGVELQGWRLGYFAKLVKVYAEAGDKSRVEGLLTAGRKGITPLHAFYQPPALCQLAEAELAAGYPERAEATWAEAVAVAVANPNSGSRYLGAAQVAFSVARSGRELPEKVAAQIEALSSSATK